jgi:hypothetical protein
MCGAFVGTIHLCNHVAEVSGALGGPSSWLPSCWPPCLPFLILLEFFFFKKAGRVGPIADQAKRIADQAAQLVQAGWLGFAKRMAKRMAGNVGTSK